MPHLNHAIYVPQVQHGVDKGGTTTTYRQTIPSLEYDTARTTNTCKWNPDAFSR